MSVIQSIRLQHFRSYKDDSFEFSRSVNIIVGPNAGGKTNLIEAILMVARGGLSYRAKDSELIEFGQPWARVDTSIDNEPRAIKLVKSDKTEKTYDLFGQSFRRLPYKHIVPVVLFEPNNLNFIIGSSDQRRDFLDNLLSQTVPGYMANLRLYNRALSQRNRLLKSPQVNPEQLFPWNVRLSETGGIIARHRSSLAEGINQKIGSLYQELSVSKTNVSVEYLINTQLIQYESQMLHQLESRTERDILLGHTTFGPHREDLMVLFNQHPGSEVASRGETRTFVLGLKLIETDLLKENKNTLPILLLDDVFSELDGARRQALTNYLQPYQTFITTTDADVVIEHFSKKSNIILVSKNN